MDEKKTTFLGLSENALRNVGMVSGMVGAPGVALSACAIATGNLVVGISAAILSVGGIVISEICSNSLGTVDGAQQGR